LKEEARNIKELAAALEPELVAVRRDLHKHAETGWTEFRTTALLAKRLKALGYEVDLGEKVIRKDAMMGVPNADILKGQMERAIAQGADPALVAQMAGGMTGLVATLRHGEGPTLALRFDIDANDINESQDEKHRPYREGFASINSGAMHACGHDGHAAAGLGAAIILAEIQDHLSGTLKLIFQPGEEGSRGAAAMEAAGILEGVNYIFGGHIGVKARHLGDLICGAREFLATTKLDVTFTGKPAHAGMSPEEGRNALLAAATCAVNLHAISRHGQGASRINVGSLHAGQGRNVIPPNAVLQLETRGVTSKINDFMADEARRIIQAAALMYGVEYKAERAGATQGGESSPDMEELAATIAKEMDCFTNVTGETSFGATEDFSHLLTSVQRKGGKGTYVQLGADVIAGHHQFYFDFNEKVISYLCEFMARMAYRLLGK
jgi:aminobenzoyl-glutamate utilization protein A